jgi:Mn-dependent DtxR family transcriptional regulator
VRGHLKLGKNEEQIVALLQKSEDPLTLVEIAAKLEKSPKSVFKSLKKLFEESRINIDIKTHKYKLSNK